MIVLDIIEIKVVDILSRGVPNKECIVLRVYQETDFGQYGIMLGYYTGSGTALPLFDHLFWFGDGLIKEGDWVFVFTGPGTARLSQTDDKKHNVFSLHWNKATTVFANTNIVPIIFRIDAVIVPNPPKDRLQLELLKGESGKGEA